jgi:uncharacterized repeat protein (TIGR03833 family)
MAILLNPKVGIQMKGNNRANVKIGATVSVVLKEDQRSGQLTEGVVTRILTNSANHPHGIKVRLEDGQVGRVKKIHDDSN